MPGPVFRAGTQHQPARDPLQPFHQTLPPELGSSVEPEHERFPGVSLPCSGQSVDILTETWNPTLQCYLRCCHPGLIFISYLST